MHKNKFLLIMITIAFALCGCSDPDERYDAGYSDGFAVGYNTACKIRSTLIEGDWDSEHYTNGYNAGLIDGETECLHNK